MDKLPIGQHVYRQFNAELEKVHTKVLVVGDRCQNVAEYVIYLALGMDVRHTSLDNVLAEIEAQSVADCSV